MRMMYKNENCILKMMESGDSIATKFTKSGSLLFFLYLSIAIKAKTDLFRVHMTCLRNVRILNLGRYFRAAIFKLFGLRTPLS